MSYRVSLEIFEGPLDLLLHLVKKEELDVYDIPIARITDQYLQYLELMKEMSLDVAGEYLVMAATLTHLKSRMLLPPSEDEEEEGEEDPRAALVQQLLEYQRFRDAALGLRERPVLTRDVFRREPTEPDDDGEAGVRLRDVTTADLLEAFREVLDRSLRESFHEVITEQVSVAECIERIMERLDDDRPLGFHELFDGLPSRQRLIATFLALLELVKAQIIRARQDVAAGTIVLVRAPAARDHAEEIR